MKSPTVVSIDEALARWPEFDAVLDARSPAEHGLDRLPGAWSTPVLDDAERVQVGTMHKQVGPFEARRVGAALVARNIASLLEGQLADRPRGWRPLVYCWRGGNRSGALATVLARVGWPAHVLEGGYKAYRARVVADLQTLPARLQFVVLAGRTGSGKTALLERLAARGLQVLDLEALAVHRGSLLGLPPGAEQPPQKRFESQVWEALRRFDPARPVIVESESKKVGERQVPDALIAAMRASPCIVVEAGRSLRARLLLADYTHFVHDPDALRARLAPLAALHGHATIAEWHALIDAGHWTGFVEALLERHYDPAYDRSMNRNFVRLAQAPVVTLASADALEAAADEIARRAAAISARPPSPAAPGSA